MGSLDGDSLFTNILLLETIHIYVNPLSANFTKWTNTLKQFVGKLSSPQKVFGSKKTLRRESCLSLIENFNPEIFAKKNETLRPFWYRL